MTERKNEFGLVIERANLYGTEYVTARVVRRENGNAAPYGCSGDGESFYGDAPKHLKGLNLDGLSLHGFVSDTSGDFLLHGIEYRDIFAASEPKLRRMVKTIAKVNARINKDNANEPGDMLTAFAAALKLTFVVEKLGAWRWMTVAEGRNRYRALIAEALAEAAKKTSRTIRRTEPT